MSRYFNSQPHKEADCPRSSVRSHQDHFNSQPHKEADGITPYPATAAVLFQLTASQGGWRRSALSLPLPPEFQLTASQGGWRRPLPETFRCPISTHSLTRRLTLWLSLSRLRIYISTHSLTRRLTHSLVNIVFAICISTHSLTRRLTYFAPEKLQKNQHFNSQPHKEADDFLCPMKTFCVFQLTASQGGWQSMKWPDTSGKAFQLTASQGGWPDYIENMDDEKEFQLTASQGGWRRSRIY